MKKHQQTPAEGTTAADTRSETAQREEAIMAFWKERGIFERSLNKAAPNGEFVFYDGPPFATGLPHYGSLLSSIAKDVVPRYKTMRGYHVRRRWGWDCHGLPIENLVEKKLGLKTKKDIYEIGIDTFNETCRAEVLRYAHDWEEYIDRVGRWVEFRNAYKTMDNTYIESVWWALSELHKKQFLYEGRKVLLYCPRCETPIAKAEVAQDNSYKDVTEDSVYVKFKVTKSAAASRLQLPENTYLLAWTTTPWTLPSNRALAVGEAIEYDLYVNAGGAEAFVVARELGAAVVKYREGEEFVVKKSFKGSELAGLSYEPLYELETGRAATPPALHTVLSADFVTTEDGTGIVHIAPMYGEDDYQLGQKNELPAVPLLGANGHFNDDAPEFIRGQYYKKAQKAILEDLSARSLLFAKQSHTHAYPHCHRCDTALIYNALTSWFINIQAVKPTMLATNEKINWVPAYLKDGRYKNSLEHAPDWNISRNRFWASPLPIWKHQKTGEVVLIDSIESLTAHVKKSGNTYRMMRHGESHSNVTGKINALPDETNILTDKGRAQVKAAAEALRDAGITHLYVSPLPRTRETASIVQEVLGLSEEQVVFDERLVEVRFGEYEGRSIDEYHAKFPTTLDRFRETPEGGENWHQVKVRMTACLYDIERTHKDANVLIISHNGPMRVLEAGARGMTDEQAVAILDATPGGLQNAQVWDVPFTPLPVNRDFELDLHRPYIDEITLIADDGAELTRIPEVIDCWVESGSMPFAEHHHPFADGDHFTNAFPADFISEYIGQVRTWFYYMHAMSVLLFDVPSFKNVVTTGNILATDGAKMSKSKGNYTDPLQNFDQYGADALRLYLMSSPIMLAEDIRFGDVEVREMHNRVVGLLWNTYKFYELYKHQWQPDTRPEDSENELDQWILARLAEFAREVTDGYEAYSLPQATRPVRAFVEDLSTWYVRRSRDRIKGDDTSDRARALATLRHVLLETSKLIAPVMPFIAESIYQGIEGEVESVHLESWPEVGTPSSDVLTKMQTTREVISHALKARAEAGIKVRQPLARLVIPQGADVYEELIVDEVNVKAIDRAASKDAPVSLDTTLTPELKAEGELRDLIRHVQQLRKRAGCSPDEKVTLRIATTPGGKAFIDAHNAALTKPASISAVEFGEVEGDAVVTETASFAMEIRRTA